MEYLENKELKITLNPKGAELTGFYDKSTETEYMWSGDPAFWGKHAPVLFPIVGTLKDNTYLYEGKAYQLSRHGFARDQMFSVEKQAQHTICFSLAANETTLQQFPFAFRLDLLYTLQGRSLTCTYRVTNTDSDVLYFSIGGHPAFRLPLEKGTLYNDYYLEFEKEETAGRWLISADGLIEAESIPLMQGKILPLQKSLFHKDAIVLKHLHSTAVSLLSHKTSKGFRFDFTGFPYLGIWAAKDADFICIEPWCGIADAVNTNQDFTAKEGINSLQAGAVFERSWRVDILG